ncbi:MULTISPECIES: hypothetical protein [Stenotrophomonas]|jgi:hypothetical protein|uniref:hypothetical protein n=1 Tax=Stenotrophomonas TaxID=40323 RepID=UPI001782AE8F|nr:MULTISPECIES: hypothetical protein [Stenotrophomonas]MCI1111697.1 hypothetical protein [Stenotrophomonas maltophilia]MDV3463757.1 hypothetical protein [Stenotrophomonas sp. C960]MDV3531968.1 hypothetical protein [Stenotrophomonas sp. C2866]
MVLLPGQYRILAYRGFHDLPRMMLVTDSASKRWVLDCPFEDERDDYAPVYRIHAVDTDITGPSEVWERHTLGLLPDIGALSVNSLQFDETRRASFILM